MRETRSSGSVEGVMSNRDPYSDSTINHFKHTANPLCEFTLGSNQAQHEMPLPGEIVKMSRVHQHRFASEEFDRQIFVRPRYWHAKYRVPSPLHTQALASFPRSQLPVKLRQIGQHAIKKLFLNTLPLFEQNRHRPLNRRIH